MIDHPQDQDTLQDTGAPQSTGALNGKSEPPAYYAYLLRLWRVTEMDRPPPQGQLAIWRASLQAARNGELLSFANLDELFGFLWRQTGMTSDTAEDEDVARA